MAISKRKLIYPIFTVLVLLSLVVMTISYLQLKDFEGLRTTVVDEIRAQTQREVQIGTAQLDFTEGIGLLLGEVTLKGASVQESDMTCKQVLVLLRWLPLLKGEVNIQKIILEGLMLQITRNDQGIYNMGDLASKDSVPSSAVVNDVIGAGLMHHVQVRDSELWMVDHYISSGSKPLVTKIKNLSLSINKHSMKNWLRVHLNGEVPSQTQDSGKVKLDAKLHLAEDGTHLSKAALEGELQVTDIATEPFQPYLAKVFEQHPGEHQVSLHTLFAGTLDGHVQLSGALRHAPRDPVLPQGQATPPVPGVLDYNLVFNRDSVEFKQLDYRAGEFFLGVQGSYEHFLSDKGWLKVALKSTPFQIQNSATYLPLKVFSRDLHNRLHGILKKGEVEIASLNIEGPEALFAGRPNIEIETYDLGSIFLRRVDMGEEALPLQGVTGNVQFKDGVVKVEVEQALYEHVAIKNLVATVTHPLTEPWVAGSLEAEGALAPLVLWVEKQGNLSPGLKFLKDVKRIEGVGHGKLAVQGPLHKIEKLKWSGNVSVENAGFIAKGWTAPFHSIQGNIQFTNLGGTMDPAGKVPAGNPWTLKFENFHGDWGSHTLRDIHGESVMQNGIPLKTVSGKIQLGVQQAGEMMATLEAGDASSFLKHIVLESGEIDFNFQSTGPGPGKRPSRNKGTLEIKKLFVKHADEFRPLKNLNATVSFNNDTLELGKAEGWYGDSPLEFKGHIHNYSGPDPELILTARSADFMRQDFAGIPFLETLEYQGPATVDLKIHRTNRFMKLEKKVDLTRASYRYENFLIKPENVSNSIEVSATLGSTGEVNFKKVTFKLEDSEVNGKGFLKSLDDPQFSIQLGSDHFKTWPASQYIRPLQGSLGGNARFQVLVDGNFRNLEEAVIQGSVHLKGIEYHPDQFLIPIKFNADMIFKDELFQLYNGMLEGKDSHVRFEGEYLGGDAPQVTLKLDGPGLNLNQIVSDEGKPSKGFLSWLSETRVFSKGTGQIEIKLNRFAQKFWTLPQIAGKLTFKDQVLQTNNLTLGQPKVDEVMIMGSLSLAEIKNPSFDAVVISRNVKFENLFGMFGDMFTASLTGDTVWLKARLQGQGGNLEQIIQSLKGRLSFDLKDGRINTGLLLNGVVDLFGIPVDPKTIAERARQSNNGYLQIFGDFSVSEGVARTENFLYEEKGQRLSLVGAFDLNTSRMGTVVGVAPFRRVGRVIEKIPILGTIVTGGKEGSLITSYYKVEGPFSNPKVESVPFKSISEKVLGTLEGIITAPSDLFSNQEPAIK